MFGRSKRFTSKSYPKKVWLSLKRKRVINGMTLVCPLRSTLLRARRLEYHPRNGGSGLNKKEPST